MIAGGPSLEAVSNDLPRSILEYGAWLEARGEAGPKDTAWHISVDLDGADLDGQGLDPCYASDLAPMPPDEVERLLRYVRFAQADLASAAELPPELLDWLPEGLVAEHTDPWAPDVRTIRGILTHALQLEVFYREGLHDGRAAGIFEPVMAAAKETARTYDILRAVAEQYPDRVFHPRRYHPSRGEGPPADWNLRKAIRRLISHDRAHAAEITQRRTWLLLGVPKQE